MSESVQPPDMWLRRLQDAVVQAERMMESPAGPWEHLLGSVEAARPHLDALRAAIENAVAVHEWLETTWLDYTPDNWHPFVHEQLDLVGWVAESGLCLMWAPRPEVVHALLLAPPGEHGSVLVKNAREILDDCDAVLTSSSEGKRRDHDDAFGFAGEAVAAPRDGHFNGAQALAALGLSHVLHTLGYEHLGGAYKEFSLRDIDEEAILMIRAALLEVCTASALIDFSSAETTRFNRHATAHGERRFFSQPNALSAILLLVGWLRELKWREDHSVGGEANQADEEPTT